MNNLLLILYISLAISWLLYFITTAYLLVTSRGKRERIDYPFFFLLSFTFIPPAIFTLGVLLLFIITLIFKRIPKIHGT